MQVRICLLLGVLLTAPAAKADTGADALAAYESTVRKTYARETMSQCLARARTTSTEIVVCGERDRKDRFRLHRSGTVIIREQQIFSPAERALAVKAMVDYSHHTVGAGYESVAIPKEQGYIRNSYEKAANLFLGRDADVE